MPSPTVVARARAIRPKALLVCTVLLAAAAAPARAGDISPCRTYDALEDFSEDVNPSGTWSYREGGNLLPKVASWQKNAGGWATAQPGWAESEDGNNRLPFFFVSNGSENFQRDYLAGDLVIHTTDDLNGAGNAAGEIVWTSPFDGTVTVGGAAWMGRDIGRSNDWKLLLNDTELTHGSLASGDSYSRAMPFAFDSGSGGTEAVENLAVTAGDEIRLVLVRTSTPGDFVGLHVTVACNSIASTTTTTTLPQRECGDSIGTSPPPITATDALFILKSAVGQFSCENCVCDTNDSGTITASDALLVLKFAVGQDVSLNCPACD